MKFTDENGVEIEAFTQEELDAKIAEAIKNATPAPVQNPPEPVAPQKPADEQPDPVRALAEQVASLAATIRAKEVKELARAYAPGDIEKQNQIAANFSKLTGFDETPEGLAKQAEAAAAMAGIDVTGVSVGDVAATGGGRNVDNVTTTKPSEADASLQKILGITPEDVAKFGEAAGIKTA